MPCSRKRFPGAELITVRSEKSKYTIWSAEPRDHLAEAQIVAELKWLAVQNVIRKRELRANAKHGGTVPIPRLTLTEKKKIQRQALARAAAVSSQMAPPSQTMSPAPSLSVNESGPESESDEEKEESSKEDVDSE